MAYSKVCLCCRCDKVLSTEYYSGTPHVDGSPSYSAICISCCIIASHARWESGREAREVRAEAKRLESVRKSFLPRKCRSCGIEKPPGDFYSKGTLRSGAVCYRPDCKACNIADINDNPLEKERIRQASADWRAEDPNRSRKSCRDYRFEHADELNETARLNRLDPIKGPILRKNSSDSYYRHQDKRISESKAWHLANIDWRKIYMSWYWREYPDKARQCRDARRALKAGAEGFYTSDDIAVIRKRQNDRCNNPHCNIDLCGKGSVDHIVALINGGSNWPSNLQMLCKPCNSKKRSRDNAEFLYCYAIEKGIPLPPAEGLEV